jgi:hypothetical protein
MFPPDRLMSLTTQWNTAFFQEPHRVAATCGADAFAFQQRAGELHDISQLSLTFDLG